MRVKSNIFISMTDEADYDLAVIGINTYAKEHCLAWYINKDIYINLSKSPDLKIKFGADAFLLISNYIFEEDYYIARLIKNRAVEIINHKKPYLLPEFMQYDFLLTLAGHYTPILDVFLQKLSVMSVVQHAQHLPTHNIKNIEYLILT
ncbi:MAG: IPExxxVDY family protein [Cytophagales bacterium]|nr:IPExxxVDY family protein [Cytophagales bacterium]